MVEDETNGDEAEVPLSSTPPTPPLHQPRQLLSYPISPTMYTFPYWHTFSVLVKFVIQGPDVVMVHATAP